MGSPSGGPLNYGGLMKFTTDLVTAVLVQNGVKPVNVDVITKCSFYQPIEDYTFRVYCAVSQLVGYLPGYIASFEGSALAFDIELELRQLLVGAQDLCDEYESLGFISVWLELHRRPQDRQAFLKSTFDLPEAQCHLANQLITVSEPKVSQMASSWLLHMSDFLTYVRNTLAGEMLFMFSLFDELRQLALHRKRTQTIKTVTHGSDVLKVMLAALDIESIDMHLRNTPAVWTRKNASDYIRRIQSYAHSGARTGYVTCHRFNSGNEICRSLPAYLRAGEHEGGLKQINRLIADTVVGRNKDIGLSDF